MKQSLTNKVMNVMKVKGVPTPGLLLIIMVNAIGSIERSEYANRKNLHLINSMEY